MIISSATAISPQQVHQVATPFTVIIIALIQGEEKEEEHNIDNIIRVQNFIAIELKHFRHQEHLLNIFFCLPHALLVYTLHNRTRWHWQGMGRAWAG